MARRMAPSRRSGRPPRTSDTSGRLVEHRGPPTSPGTAASCRARQARGDSVPARVMPPVRDLGERRSLRGATVRPPRRRTSTNGDGHDRDRDRRPRAHRRPADRRAGHHRRVDRLVLLPPVRLAQRVRRPARRRARRALPDPPGRRRLHDQADVPPRHRRPGHPVLHRGRASGEVVDFMPPAGADGHRQATGWSGWCSACAAR